ncbi:hypothetical protein Q3G72_031781 [Acer saccharum]|nr:hypothetical protein Q3G72_031781 [Acer saccharum]
MFVFVFVASCLDETEVENKMRRWLSFVGGGVWCIVVAGFLSRRLSFKAMAYEGVGCCGEKKSQLCAHRECRDWYSHDTTAMHCQPHPLDIEILSLKDIAM